MMTCGLTKQKGMLSESFILKSGRFGLFTSKVICHRNGSLIFWWLSRNADWSFWKVYCYAKKTGDSPENNANWQCYANGKWSPSNGVVTCSSSARSKSFAMPHLSSSDTFLALKNDRQTCCPLMTVKMPGQRWPLTLERDPWSYQRDEWLRYHNENRLTSVKFCI